MQDRTFQHELDSLSKIASRMLIHDKFFVSPVDGCDCLVCGINRSLESQLKHSKRWYDWISSGRVILEGSPKEGT